jgi:hypothetical protein
MCLSGKELGGGLLRVAPDFVLRLAGSATVAHRSGRHHRDFLPVTRPHYA